MCRKYKFRNFKPKKFIEYLGKLGKNMRLTFINTFAVS